MNIIIKKPGCFFFIRRAVFHELARKKINFADQISQTKTNVNKISYMNRNFLYSRVPNNRPHRPRLLIFEKFSTPPLPDLFRPQLLLISKTFAIHKTKSK